MTHSKSPGAWFATLAAVLSSWTVACSDPDPAPASATPVVPQAAPAAVAAPPLATGPVAIAEQFELRAQVTGPYAVGAPVPQKFALELTGRGGWHVNAQYPTKVRVTAPAGVRLPRPELARADAAEFGEAKARFEIPIEPTAPGDHPVTATVSFSMCSPTSCIMQERAVTVAVAVPPAG